MAARITTVRTPMIFNSVPTEVLAGIAGAFFPVGVAGRTGAGVFTAGLVEMLAGLLTGAVRAAFL